jgi:Protein of unknown function (DUF2490)
MASLAVTYEAIGEMGRKSVLPGIILASTLSTICPSVAEGQSSTTETQAWPEADFHVQLPSNLRVLAFTGLEQGAGYPYQQWYTAAGLGYQFKNILTKHLENIDPDKEHYLVVAGGYEFLRTVQSGKVKDEDRMVIEVMPGFRPLPWLLVRDRNRVEFRWVDGAYSTRYRNQLSIETDILAHGYRFTPFASAEAFYGAPKQSWNEEYYTAGVQWPHKRLMMLETYYRRENCPTCKPAHWNVGGATLNFYLRNAR